MKSLSAWIVHNGSLKSHKFAEHLQWIEKSLAARGVVCTVINNGRMPAVLCADRAELRGNLGAGRPDFAVFWDKDVHLALQLEALGLRLFNPSSVVAACDDKALTHIALAGHGIRMPKTIVAPLVFPGLDEPDAHYLEYVQDELRFPMIVKECFGSFGAQVYLAGSAAELAALRDKLLYKPHLYQQYIASSYGRDVRVQVVGGEIAATVMRTSENDFRSNVTNGGRMLRYDAPAEYTDMALKCARILGADFCGVDMLLGFDGGPVLCEVNSNAHFVNLYHCAGVNVADCMAGHILRIMTHG